MAYNYSTTYTEEIVIDVADFIDSSTYGSDTTYGDSATYGSLNIHQVRIDFSRQKCQAMKISIEDLQDTTGEGLELSNALFVVGIKGSEGKINESKQYGSS